MPGAFDDTPGRQDNLPYGGPWDDATNDGPSGGFSDVPGGLDFRTLFELQGESGGLATLPKAISFSGGDSNVLPTLWYQGKDATLSDWSSDGGVSETLTATGSGGTIGLDSATPHSDDRAAVSDGTRGWEAASGVAAIGTSHFAMEAVARAEDITAAVGIASQFGTGGWILYHVSGNWRLLCRDDSGAPNVSVQTAGVSYAWAHIFVVGQWGGTFKIWLNGVGGGEPSGAGLTSLNDSTNPFKLGVVNGATAGDVHIAHFAFWKPSDVGTYDQNALAYERYARAFGLWHSTATISSSNYRGSSAYMDKISHVDGIRRQHYMSVGAHRYTRRPDDALRVSDGYLPENSTTNELPYSTDLTPANWFKLNCTATANAAVAPNGLTEASALEEDGTLAAQHYLEDQGSSAIDQYCCSVYQQPVNRQWVRLGLVSTTDGSQLVYFDLGSGRVGTVSGSPDDYGIYYLGANWYRCWIVMTFTASELHTFRIQPAETDNDVVFDGLTQESLYVWNAQFEAGRTYPSSPIPTSGATVTRSADDLVYDCSSLRLTRGTLACDVLLEPNNGISNRRLAVLHDGTDNERVLLYDASGTPTLVVTDGGVEQANVTGTTDPRDNLWHEMRALWEANAVSYALDGTEEGTPDTSSTMPTMDTLTIGKSRASGGELGGLIKPRILSKPTTDSVTDFGGIMSYGEISMIGNATTTSITAGTPAIVAGTTTLGNASEFTMPSDMRLTYGGTSTKKFIVHASYSLSGAANRTVEVYIYKNGVAVTESQKDRKIGSGGDVGNGALHALVELASTDYVELYADIDTTDTPLFEHVLMTAHEVS